MAHPARFVLWGGLALALVASPARSEEPSGSPPDGAEARLAAAVVESSNLRVRALLERAELLSRSGKTDEALAALGRVEEVHREGVALVRELVRDLSARGPSAEGPIVVIHPASRRHPWAPPRSGPLDDPAPRPEPVDPVAPALDFLRRAQGQDGRFDGDTASTAWAVLAMLEAWEQAPETAGLVVPAVRAVRALVASQDTSGWIGEPDDVEGHVVATWAISAALASLGREAWDAASHDATVAAHRWAVDRIVVGVKPGGGWGLRDRSVGEQLALDALTAAALHEARALGLVAPEGIDLALGRLADAAARFRKAGLDHRGVTTALTLRAGGRAVPETARGSDSLSYRGFEDLSSHDLLLHTTHYAYAANASEWNRWEPILEEEVARQVRGGPLGGSWEPRREETRVAATAIHLLAWLVPSAEYRAPR